MPCIAIINIHHKIIASSLDMPGRRGLSLGHARDEVLVEVAARLRLGAVHQRHLDARLRQRRRTRVGGGRGEEEGRRMLSSDGDAPNPER